MNTNWSSAPTLRIPKDTSAAVRRGHPWVYGLQEVPACGTPVRLVDPKGTAVGFGLADTGSIRVRVLGAGEPTGGDLHSLIGERVRRADGFRFRLIAGETDCWRVINGAGDGLPGVVLDRYGAIAVLKIYSAAWTPHLDAIVRAVKGLGWATHLLRRFGVKSVDGRKGAEPLFGMPPEEVVVLEHGMKMLVRPWSGQKTGTFLDQREHRKLVREVAAGRTVANLFSYNGGFSVAAALGGAAQVTSVDIAPMAIEDAKENFRLNGLDVSAHGFEVADAFAWRAPRPLGMIIVDPPSLARTVKARGAATSAYRKLHEKVAGRIQRDGLVGSSSCTAQLDWDRWSRAVTEGLSRHGQWAWSWQSRAPFDHPVALGHPEGHYLKFGLIRRL